jgi:hypothetical protein
MAAVTKNMLSQNMPKFELYKHNDELFNIYSMGFFMNFELLPILTDYANQHRTLWEIHIKIFSSETTGPIPTKLWWNSPWMAPFQNCVW